MRISDWSSDVCSSDLLDGGGLEDARAVEAALVQQHPRETRIIVEGGGEAETTGGQRMIFEIELLRLRRRLLDQLAILLHIHRRETRQPRVGLAPCGLGHPERFEDIDRKSTRLNSSH